MGIAGIDLGTTNSSVARLIGANIQIFKDGQLGLMYTPSAVYLNADKRLVVGVEAKKRVFLEPNNATFEFKRNMGTDSPFTFERTGLVMQPEELSAEVLKTLNGHVVRSGGSPITSAVVTVPADFDQPQWEATYRAATLAGIKNCVLHPEPVAAAQAYSFSNEADNTFWLVYDIGGGTFDAAIVRVRDGEIKVVEHKGNPRLGGSDIDIAIVNELLIPALPAPFTDEEKKEIRDRNPKFAGVWVKLKGGAEDAKIALSQQGAESADIEFEYLCRHSSGAIVDYSYKLQRADMDRLATPIVRKTINLVKEVLIEARMSPADIGKLILVGGPTMMPVVRAMLKELQIELEYSVDPITVVAEGAAILAASKFGLGDDDVVAVEGDYTVKLDYQAVSTDTEPEIAGTFSAFGNARTDFTGYTVEFMNDSVQPKWRSGKVPLRSNGAFLTTLVAKSGVANRFVIELSDSSGSILPVAPAYFEIVVKGSGVIGEMVHNHNFGVELAGDEVLAFYEKGQPLPYTSQKKTLHTTVAVKKGATDRFLCVPVCEGERMRASRNTRIGELIISANDVPMDIPVGTPVDVVLEIDTNLVIRASGRIELIERDFEQRFQGKLQSPDVKQLEKDAQAAIDRLAKLRDRGQQSSETEARRLLKCIEEEGMVVEIRRHLARAANEPGAGLACSDVICRLNSSLDELEDVLEWPTLTADATAKLSKVRDVVTNDEYAAVADRSIFSIIEAELNQALHERSADALHRVISALDALQNDIYSRDPQVWINTFNKVKLRKDEMTDQARAGRLIQEGESSVSNRHVVGIQQAVRGLWALLPNESSSTDGRLESTVTL